MKKAGEIMQIPIDDFIRNRYAITLVGPTAVGKTSVSLFIAEYFPVEIISADSRQIYKYLDIGTAKPTQTERAKVPHHFIDICFPDEYYSAGQFGKDAEKKVNEVFSKSKIPLIVGGSGLYIKALCEGFFEEDFSPEEKVQVLKIRKELSYLSRDALYSRLKEVDPETAMLYPDKNYVRLMRALEFYYIKGVPISVYRKMYHRSPNFKTVYIGLICPRETLYARIEKRVDKMWKEGLPGEVQRILDMGYSPELNSLRSVGYKETIDFLLGKLSEAETIAEIKKNSRRYAKRQITWFKKVQNINWFDISKSNFEKDLIDYLVSFFQKIGSVQ